MSTQVERNMARYWTLPSDMEKYLYLTALSERNETLFYKILMDNIKELAPIVYTPTVGVACLKFGQNYRKPGRGMYFTSEDQGVMGPMAYNWPHSDVDVIVVTDGSRILGLGDLGAHGMAIPIGKLSLYVAAGGIDPKKVLPITIDVGTNNQKLLKDPLYLGIPEPRVSGERYYDIIDEFMHSVTSRWPRALVQFEDFSTDHALPILKKYREKFLCFNDDIQGTGAVALSGLLSALRVRGLPTSELPKQTILCLGAGSAGIGVCESVVNGMVQEGLTPEEARSRIYVVDQYGLLVSKDSERMSEQQKPFARNDFSDNSISLPELVEKIKPTILLGFTGVAGTFTKEIVTAMAKNTERPTIFALSNPTRLSECTAQQAFEWTNGKCIFASGSPFENVTIDGKVHHVSQGNNMYVFPGLGLGATLCGATKITDGMLYAASKALTATVSETEISNGQVYPDVTQIREVSAKIACEVIKVAQKEKLSRVRQPEGVELKDWVKENMYVPQYFPLVNPQTSYGDLH
eukprot:TRINITY_DN9607_c0_g1_i1.p1 TRINITY_DN9607_c0_g1~~TRINITY_DN9607_c0_g1_i1.p1  ORF type:complete len:598 (-),score=272.74 TRINITY_DN9607_c0_g1_i1:8-1567(-)